MYRRKFWLSFFALLASACAQMQPSARPAEASAPDSTQSQSDNTDSIAAVAARAKAQKNLHSKTTITDDNFGSSLGPFPRLRMNEAENGEAVIAAIATYKASHAAKDTEAAVHVWYDEYDKELAAAIEHNLEIKSLRSANVNNAAALCQNSQDYEHYEQCLARRNTEINGARYDVREIARNNNSIVRLQHSLMNIRNGLQQMGLRYDWFKVRTTNNIDRF